MSTGLTIGTISSLYGLQCPHHQPHPVLALDHRRRAVGDRPDGDRATVVQSQRRDRARRRRAGPQDAASRGRARARCSVDGAGGRGKLPAYAASLGEVDEVKREEDEFFNGVLHAARYSAEQRRVSVRTDLVPGHSAKVIVHYAVAHAHDLIVVAHHVHLFGDVFLGSTADQVAHHAPCPVMVVR